jgi:hypothetical protein
VLSRKENRCVLTHPWYMCHSKYLILLLGVLVFWNGAQKPHSLSDDEANMGYITGTCKTRGTGRPLIQSGGSSLT